VCLVLYFVLRRAGYALGGKTQAARKQGGYQPIGGVVEEQVACLRSATLHLRPP
jgi:hypothetical protein